MSQHTAVWQDHNSQKVVSWTPKQPPQAVEGPLDLDLFVDCVLDVDLAAGQLAFHEQDGQIRRVYLDGHHHLDIGHASGQVEPAGHLVFVRCDAPVTWHWRKGRVLIVDTGNGPTELPIRGACALQIDHPTTFFRAVLAGLDDHPHDRLVSVLDTLVRANLEQRVREVVEDQTIDPIRAQVLLESLEPADLNNDLADLGLACHQLTIALPVMSEDPDTVAEQAQPIVCYDDVI